MISQYLDGAMRSAVVERMEDGSYFAHAAALRGPWADGVTEAEARQNLRSVLEDWSQAGFCEKPASLRVSGVTQFDERR